MKGGDGASDTFKPGEEKKKRLGSLSLMQMVAMARPAPSLSHHAHHPPSLAEAPAASAVAERRAIRSDGEIREGSPRGPVAGRTRLERGHKEEAECQSQTVNQLY